MCSEPIRSSNWNQVSSQFNIYCNSFCLFFSNNGAPLTQDQANGYVKIWNQLDFVCGAGFSSKISNYTVILNTRIEFSVFANSEVCGSSVFNNQTAAMRQCDNDFNVKSMADPAQACA